MPCAIVSNNIQSQEIREAVNEAVRDGVGERAGEWKAVVYQAHDYPALAVRIEGPKGLRWSWAFREKTSTGIYPGQDSPSDPGPALALGGASPGARGGEKENA